MLVHHNVGTLGRWDVWTLERWYIIMLEHWNVGTLRCCNAITLALCDMQTGMDICLYADVSSSLCRRRHLCLCANRTTSMLKKISDCQAVPDFSNIFLNFSQLFYFGGHCSCDICYRYVRLPRRKSQEERAFISRMPGKNRHPASFHCVIHIMTVC